MIRKRTVFILGAGASCEYGFPLGSQLREAIIQMALDENYPSELNQAISEAWSDLRWHRDNTLCALYGEETLNDFGNSFLHSGMYSIDAYLQHREEFRNVGAATIGLIISYCERHDLLFDQPRLYAWLAERMGRTPDALKNNPVTFVTFNYDRSLEYFMVRSLQELTDDAVAAHEVIDSLNIIHMHGSLGRLPRRPEESGKYQEVQVYESLFPGENRVEYDYRDAKRWESTLKLVGERISEEQDAQHQKARDAIAAAEVVCFLGFGFDKDNMKLLGFPYTQDDSLDIKLKYKNRDVGQPTVIGTAYELSDSRRREIARRLVLPNGYATRKRAEQHFHADKTCEVLLDDNIQTLDAEWDLPKA